ncbi:MAG: carboxypeptidase regulatory-like domain-containing protein, partial [Armatimonadaceae bacterium]
FNLGPGTTVVDRNGASVLLIEEDKTAQIDFYLPSAPQPVRGRVVDGTGVGIAGAFVSATSTTTNSVVATATTDSDGNYELTTTGTPSATVLPAGSYTVTGSALGYSNNSVSVAVSGPNPVVAPNIVLTVLPPGSASGFVTGVTGAGVSGSTVKFFLVRSGVVSPTATYTATTGANQTANGYTFNYRLGDVAAGDYVVTVERPGLVGDPVQVRTTVSSGNETRRINFRLLPPRVYGDGIQLISLPFNYSGIPTMEIFGLSRTGDNDGDGDSGDVQDVAIFDGFNIADWTGLEYNSGNNVPINTGKGYFVKFGSITSVSKTGAALPGNQFTITLAPGWNLIGHPFANPINPTVPGADLDLYQQARILDGAASYTMTQAVQANLVRGVLFGYSGSNSGSQYFETRVMKAWAGYWFRNATNRSLKLVLEYPEQRSVVSRVAKTITRASLEQPVMRTIAPGSLRDWRLQVGARQGRLLDTDNTVGVSGRATDQFDSEFDVEKPPVMDAAPAVRLGIVGSDADGRKTAFADDVRSQGKASYHWDIEVSSNVDGDIEVIWPSAKLLPRELDATLVDMGSGKRVAMRNQPGYRVPHSGRSVHRFRIEVSRSQTAPMAFTNVRIAGSRGSSRVIRFGTTRDADVVVELQTLGGKLVRRFVTRSVGTADNNVVWDGRDSDGVQVPAGTYMVNMTATDSSGRSIRQRIPLTSVR